MDHGVKAIKRRRDEIVSKLEQANRAAAIGRLLLGETRTWQEYLEAGAVDSSLPRRSLRGGLHDVRRRLSKSIRKFLDENFVDASIETLAALYEKVKAFRGLEMGLVEFEEQFAQIRPSVLRGTPAHATVVVSLWGLRFMFPEDFLAKDIATLLMRTVDADLELRKHSRKAFAAMEQERGSIADLLRTKQASQRSCFHACFGLLEAYLNGVAWEATQASGERSINDQDLNYLQNCTDKTLRSKLINVPRIVGGKALWDEGHPQVHRLFAEMKPLRDSLTHPSPFRALEKFGGYDKLSHFYRVDIDMVIGLAKLIRDLVVGIHCHLKGSSAGGPHWLDEVTQALQHCEDKRSSQSHDSG